MQAPRSVADYLLLLFRLSLTRPLARALRQALVAAALAAGAAVARDCDTYSFCDDPGMTIVEGNFEYGLAAYGHTCLADTKNAQSFRYGWSLAGLCLEGVCLRV